MFTITVTDDEGATDTQDVTITITGTNDTPEIETVGRVGTVVEQGNAADGSVTPGTASATGTVDFSDVDLTNMHQFAVSLENEGDFTAGTSLEGTYGSIIIDANTGQWQYQLNNLDVDTQSLRSGESATDVFYVRVTDDAGADDVEAITITIQGADDSRVLEYHPSGVAGQKVDEGARVLITPDSGAADVSDLTVQHIEIRDVKVVNLNENLNLSGLEQALSGAVHEIGTVNTATVSAGPQLTLRFEGTGVNSQFKVVGQYFGSLDIDAHNTLTINLNDGELGLNEFVTDALTQLTLTGAASSQVSINHLDSQLDATETLTVDAQALTGAGVDLGLVRPTHGIALTLSNQGDVVTLYGNFNTGRYTGLDDFAGGGAYTGDGHEVTGTLNLGEGNDGVITYGSIDLTGVTLSGAERLTSHSNVRLTADQLTQLDSLSFVGDLKHFLEVTVSSQTELDEVMGWFNQADNPMSLEGSMSGVSITPTGSFSPDSQVMETAHGTHIAMVSSSIMSGAQTEQNATDTMTVTGVIDLQDLAAHADSEFVYDQAQSSVVWSEGSLTGTGLNTSDILNSFSITRVGAVTGALSWRYSHDSSLVDFLAEDETLTVTLRVRDENTEDSAHNIVLTITGTNDLPVISIADSNISTVQEFDGVPAAGLVLTSAGSLSFSDLDYTDSFTVTSIASDGNLGELSVSVSEEREIEWVYQVDAGSVEYLDVTENKVDTFTVTLSDGNGGVVTEVITVTVAGGEDRPQILGSRLLTAAELMPFDFNTAVNHSSGQYGDGQVPNRLIGQSGDDLFFVGTGSVLFPKTDRGGDYTNQNYYNQNDPLVDSFVQLVQNSGRGFAALQADGTIVLWGLGTNGGVPTDARDTKYASSHDDRLVTNSGGDGYVYTAGPATGESGFVSVHGSSTGTVMTAIKEDGSVRVWGGTESKQVSIDAALDLSNLVTLKTADSHFAALLESGEIETWGHYTRGHQVSSPEGQFVELVATYRYYVAVSETGELQPFGHNAPSAPSGDNYSNLFTSNNSFSAFQTPEGEENPTRFVVFGDTTGEVVLTNGDSFVSAVSIMHTPADYDSVQGNSWDNTNQNSFVALTSQGYIHSVGLPDYIEDQIPERGGYTKVFANARSFAALHADGTVDVFGNHLSGGEFNGVSLDGHNVVDIYASNDAFAALTDTGKIIVWGNSRQTTGAPAIDDPDNLGFTKVFTTGSGFVAVKGNGTYHAWGEGDFNVRGLNGATLSESDLAVMTSLNGGVLTGSSIGNLSDQFIEGVNASSQQLLVLGQLSFVDDYSDNVDIVSSPVTPVYTRFDGSTGVLPAGIVTALQQGLTFPGGLSDYTGSARSIDWTYSSSNLDLDFLVAGETVEFDFDVKLVDAADPSIESETHTLTFTITGTNDAPALVYEVGKQRAELAEMGEAEALTQQTVQLTFTDLDHSATLAENGVRLTGNVIVDAYNGGVGVSQVDFASDYDPSGTVVGTRGDFGNSNTYDWRVDFTLDALSEPTDSYQVLLEKGGDYRGVTLAIDGQQLLFGTYSGSRRAYQEVTIDPLESTDLALEFDASTQSFSLLVNGIQSFSVPAGTSQGDGSISFGGALGNFAVLTEDGLQRRLNPSQAQRDAVRYEGTLSNIRAFKGEPGEDVDWNNGEWSTTAGFTDADGNPLNLESITSLVHDYATVSGATKVATVEQGEFNFNFRIPPTEDGSTAFNPFIYLAEGQKLVLGYEVEITDDQGGAKTDFVYVTINGGNSAPVFSGPLIVNAAPERSIVDLLADVDGNPLATDVDASDVLSVSDVVYRTVPNSDWLALPASVGVLVNDAGQTESEFIGATFVPTRLKLTDPTLAAGESVTYEFSYRVADNHDGLAQAFARVTVDGLNNTTEITSSAIGDFEFTEAADASAQSIERPSGTLRITDLDTTNWVDAGVLVTASPVWRNADGDNIAEDELPLSSIQEIQLATVKQSLAAALQVTAGNDAITSAGSTANVNWQFDAGQLDLDFIGEGETLTLSFEVFANASENRSRIPAVGLGEAATDYVADQRGYRTFETAYFSAEFDAANQGHGIVFTLSGDASVTFDDETQAANATFGQTITRNVASDILVFRAGYLGDLVASPHGATVEAVVAMGDLPAGSVRFDWKVDPSTGELTVWADGIEVASSVAEAGYIGFDASLDSPDLEDFSWTTASGMVKYSAQGGTTLDYTYDENRATETVSVTITGANDGVSLTAVNTSGDLDEADVSYAQTLNGSLSYEDLDLSDALTFSVDVDSVTWDNPQNGVDGETLEAGHALYKALVENRLKLAREDANSGTLTWSYSASEKDLVPLGTGETLTINYTVRVEDSSGTSSTETVTLTLEGANSQAELSRIYADDDYKFQVIGNDVWIEQPYASTTGNYFNSDGFARINRQAEFVPNQVDVDAIDLNGDGIVDYLLNSRMIPPSPGNGNTTHATSSATQTFLSDTTGDGVSFTSTVAPKWYSRGALTGAAGDLDGDGQQDIVRAGISNTFEILSLDGRVQQSLTSRAGLFEQIELVDINNDGRLDIVAGATTSFTPDGLNGLSYFLNTSTGPGDVTFGEEQFIWSTDESYRGAQEFRLGDFDGDGDADDIVSWVYDVAHIKISINTTAAGDVSPSWSTTLATGVMGRSNAGPRWEVGDLNGDGLDDIVISKSGGGNDLWVNLNQGGGTFAGNKIYHDTYGSNSSVTLGDLDDDGDLDIVMVDGEVSYIYTNDGLGNFSEIEGFRFSVNWRDINNDSFQLIDVDNDGRLDLMYTVKGSGVYVSQNPLPLTAEIQAQELVADGGNDFVAYTLRDEIQDSHTVNVEYKANSLELSEQGMPVGSDAVFSTLASWADLANSPGQTVNEQVQALLESAVATSVQPTGASTPQLRELVISAGDLSGGTESDADFSFLKRGDKLVVEYDVSVTDAAGLESGSKTIRLTLTGTDTSPEITLDASDVAALAEADGYSEHSIGLVFTDPDRDADTEQHVLSIVDLTIDVASPDGQSLTNNFGTHSNTGLVNSLKALLSLPTASDLSYENGRVSTQLDFTFDDQLFASLAQDQTATLTYTLRIADADNAASFTEEDVVIVVTGSETGPVLTSTDTRTELSETNGRLRTTGSLTLTDLDHQGDLSTDVTLTSAISPDARHEQFIQDAGVYDSALLEQMLTLTSDYRADGGPVQNLTWTFDSANEHFAWLAEGEALSLTYVIEVSDGVHAGSIASQTITVNVIGTNDAPAISVETGDSSSISVQESDNARAQSITASGTLTVTDADGSADELSVSYQIGGDLIWSGADGVEAPEIEAELAQQLLSGFDVSLDASAGELTWSFSARNLNLDFLAASETLTATFVVRVQDAYGATNTQDVVLTITGTTDAPQVTGATGHSVEAGIADDGTVIDGINRVSGTLTYNSLDVSADLEATWAVAEDYDPAADEFGTFTVDSNGAWIFTLSNDSTSVQQLDAGETTQLTYDVVATVDGVTSTETVTVTVHGTNDGPVVGTLNELALTETQLESSGGYTLTTTADEQGLLAGISDDDVATGESGTLTITQFTVGGRTFAAGQAGQVLLIYAWEDTGKTEVVLASLTVGADGSYSVSIEAGQTASIPAGQVAELDFSYAVSDGQVSTTVQRTLSVTGTADAPFSASRVSSISSEDSTGLTAGLSVSDTDTANDRYTEATVTPDASAAQFRINGATVTDANLLAKLSQLTSSVVTTSSEASYSFSLAPSEGDLDFLNAGDMLTIELPVTLADDDGNSRLDAVVFTINGENDVVAVSSPGITSVTDGDSAIVQQISISFNDADADASQSVHIGSVAARVLDNAGAELTAGVPALITQSLQAQLPQLLSLSSLTSSQNAGAGVANLAFSAPADMFDFLSLGETVELTYTVHLSDGQSVREVPVTVNVLGEGNRDSLPVAVITDVEGHLNYAAPGTTTIQSPELTISVSDELSSNQQVQVSLDEGTTWQVVPLTESGYVFVPQLSDSSVTTIHTRVSESSGFVSTHGQVVTYTLEVDATAPTADLVLADGTSITISSDDGRYAGDGKTTTANQFVQFTLVNPLGSGEQLYARLGTELTNITDSVDGVDVSWLVTLEDGANEFEFLIGDAAGNLSTGARLSETFVLNDPEGSLAPTAELGTFGLSDDYRLTVRLDYTRSVKLAEGVDEVLTVELAGTQYELVATGTADTASGIQTLSFVATQPVPTSAQGNHNVTINGPDASNLVDDFGVGVVYPGDGYASTSFAVAAAPVSVEAVEFSFGPLLDGLDATQDATATIILANAVAGAQVELSLGGEDLVSAPVSEVDGALQAQVQLTADQLSGFVTNGSDLNYVVTLASQPLVGGSGTLEVYGASPTIAVQSSAGTYGVGQQISLTLTPPAGMTQPVSLVSLAVNGVSSNDAKVALVENDDGTYTVTYTIASGDPAIGAVDSFPLEVVFTDATGKSSVAGALSGTGILVDADLPAAPAIADYTGDAAIEGSATLADGEVLTVVVNGVVYSPVPVDGSGNWSLSLSTDQSWEVGVNTLQARVSDEAGNSTASEQIYVSQAFDWSTVEVSEAEPVAYLNANSASNAANLVTSSGYVSGVANKTQAMRFTTGDLSEGLQVLQHQVNEDGHGYSLVVVTDSAGNSRLVASLSTDTQRSVLALGDVSEHESYDLILVQADESDSWAGWLNGTPATAVSTIDSVADQTGLSLGAAIDGAALRHPYTGLTISLDDAQFMGVIHQYAQWNAAATELDDFNALNVGLGAPAVSGVGIAAGVTELSGSDTLDLTLSFTESVVLAVGESADITVRIDNAFGGSTEVTLTATGTPMTAAGVDSLVFSSSSLQGLNLQGSVTVVAASLSGDLVALDNGSLATGPFESFSIEDLSVNTWSETISWTSLDYTPGGQISARITLGDELRGSADNVQLVDNNGLVYATQDFSDGFTISVNSDDLRSAQASGLSLRFLDSDGALLKQSDALPDYDWTAAVVEPQLQTNVDTIFVSGLADASVDQLRVMAGTHDVTGLFEVSNDPAAPNNYRFDLRSGQDTSALRSNALVIEITHSSGDSVIDRYTQMSEPMSLEGAVTAPSSLGVPTYLVDFDGTGTLEEIEMPEVAGVVPQTKLVGLPLNEASNTRNFLWHNGLYLHIATVSNNETDGLEGVSHNYILNNYPSEWVESFGVSGSTVYRFDGSTTLRMGEVTEAGGRYQLSTQTHFQIDFGGNTYLGSVASNLMVSRENDTVFLHSIANRTIYAIPLASVNGATVTAVEIGIDIVSRHYEGVGSAMVLLSDPAETSEHLYALTNDGELNRYTFDSSTGSFQTATVGYFEVPTRSTRASLVSGDFNGDGIADLAVIHTDGDSEMCVSVFMGNSNGEFDPVEPFNIEGRVVSVFVGDNNGDGIDDLVLQKADGLFTTYNGARTVEINLADNTAPSAESLLVDGSNHANTGFVTLTLQGSDSDSADAVESFQLRALPSASEGAFFAVDPTVDPSAEALTQDDWIAATNGQATLYFVPAVGWTGLTHVNYAAYDGELFSTPVTAIIDGNPSVDAPTNVRLEGTTLHGNIVLRESEALVVNYNGVDYTISHSQGDYDPVTGDWSLDNVELTQAEWASGVNSLETVDGLRLSTTAFNGVTTAVDSSVQVFRPYPATTLGGKNEVMFFAHDDQSRLPDGYQVTDDGVYILPSVDGINSTFDDRFDRKTTVISFTTGADIASRQFILDQGGASNNLGVMIKDGQLYVGMDSDDRSLRRASLGPVQANQEYDLVVQYERHHNGQTKAYLNGVEVWSHSSTFVLNNHDVVSIGGRNTHAIDYSEAALTRITTKDVGDIFTGTVNKLSQWNWRLDSAEDVFAQLGDWLDYQTPPSVELVATSGTSVAIDVTNGDAQAWKYSVDGGATWLEGSGTSLSITAGPTADLLVQYTDENGHPVSVPSVIPMDLLTPNNEGHDLEWDNNVLSGDVSAFSGLDSVTVRVGSVEQRIAASEFDSGSWSLDLRRLVQSDQLTTGFNKLEVVYNFANGSNLNYSDKYLVEIHNPLFSATLNGESQVMPDIGRFDAYSNTRNPLSSINGQSSGYNQKTWAFTFTTGDDLTSPQIIYEQGGGGNGFNVQVVDNKLVAHVWKGFDHDITGEYSVVEFTGLLSANTTYSLVATLDGTTDKLIGTLSDNLGGQLSTAESTYGFHLPSHSDPVGVGQVNIATVAFLSGDTTPRRFLNYENRMAFDGMVHQVYQWNTFAGAADQRDSLLSQLSGLNRVPFETDSGSIGDGVSNTGTLDVTDFVEMGSNWAYSLNSGADWTEMTGGASTFTLPEGVYAATAVRVRDAQGNVFAFDAFEVDTTIPSAPSISLTSDTDTVDDSLTRDGRFEVTGVEEGATVEYRLNDGEWTIAEPTAVDLQNNTIDVRQTDRAGNISPANSLEFYLDSTPPVASGLIIDGTILRSTQALRAGETATVTIDGQQAMTPLFEASVAYNLASWGTGNQRFVELRDATSEGGNGFSLQFFNEMNTSNVGVVIRFGTNPQTEHRLRARNVIEFGEDSNIALSISRDGAVILTSDGQRHGLESWSSADGHTAQLSDAQMAAFEAGLAQSDNRFAVGRDLWSNDSVVNTDGRVKLKSVYGLHSDVDLEGYLGTGGSVIDDIGEWSLDLSPHFEISIDAQFNDTSRRYQRLFDFQSDSQVDNFLLSQIDRTEHLTLHLYFGGTNRKYVWDFANAIVEGQQHNFTLRVTKAGEVLLFRDGVELESTFNSSLSNGFGPRIAPEHLPYMDAFTSLKFGQSHWDNDDDLAGPAVVRQVYGLDITDGSGELRSEIQRTSGYDFEHIAPYLPDLGDLSVRVDDAVGQGAVSTLRTLTVRDQIDTDAHSVLDTLSGTLMSSADGGERFVLSGAQATNGDVQSLTTDYGTFEVDRITGAYTFEPNNYAINALAQQQSQTVSAVVRHEVDGVLYAEHTLQTVVIGASDSATVYDFSAQGTAFVAPGATGVVVEGQLKILDPEANQSYVESFEYGQETTGWVVESLMEGNGLNEEAFVARAFNPEDFLRDHSVYTAKDGNRDGDSFLQTFTDYDRTRAVLRSPDFKIDREFLTFKLAGGNHSSTQLRLFVDNDGDGTPETAVRSQSASNNNVFTRHEMDVSEHLGKVAYLKLVDNHNSRWGQIAVDDIRLVNNPDTGLDNFSFNLVGGTDAGSKMTRTNSHGTLTIEKATGAWKFELASDAPSIPSGPSQPQLFQVDITDAAGDVSREVIQVDLNGIAQVSFNDTGSSNTDGVTDDPRLTVSNLNPNASQVEVSFDNGTTWFMGSTVQNGESVVTLPSPAIYNLNNARIKQVIDGIEVNEDAAHDPSVSSTMNLQDAPELATLNVMASGVNQGDLIAPTTVLINNEYQTFYALDRNRDGVVNGSDRAASNDNREQLLGVFDMLSGNREFDEFGEADGLTLRLPSSGAPQPNGVGDYAGWAGTTVDSPTDNQTTYTDFLAIWDAYNGSLTRDYSGSDHNLYAAPEGWGSIANAYSSSRIGHPSYYKIFRIGEGGTFGDWKYSGDGHYVVMQAFVDPPLVEDTGYRDTDNLTSNGTINVTSYLGAVSAWQYSTDFGNTWTNGPATGEFVVGQGDYARGQVQIRGANTGYTLFSSNMMLDAFEVDTTLPSAQLNANALVTSIDASADDYDPGTELNVSSVTIQLDDGFFLSSTNYGYQPLSNNAYRVLVNERAIEHGFGEDATLAITGLSVKDWAGNQSHLNLSVTADGETWSVSHSVSWQAPPLVIDLDGDGLETMPVSQSSAFFDFDNDGAAEQTAWVSSDDALIVFDANNDGLISGRSELVFADYLDGAQTDLEGFAAFDSNADGVVSAQDDAWGLLKIWQDFNSDGQTDEGELQAFSDFGISAIDLASSGHSEVFAGGDVVSYGQFEVIMGDGQTLTGYDAAFNFEAQAELIRGVEDIERSSGAD